MGLYSTSYSFSSVQQRPRATYLACRARHTSPALCVVLVGFLLFVHGSPWICSSDPIMTLREETISLHVVCNRFLSSPIWTAKTLGKINGLRAPTTPVGARKDGHPNRKHYLGDCVYGRPSSKNCRPNRKAGLMGNKKETPRGPFLYLHCKDNTN